MTKKQAKIILDDLKTRHDQAITTKLGTEFCAWGHNGIIALPQRTGYDVIQPSYRYAVAKFSENSSGQLVSIVFARVKA